MDVAVYIGRLQALRLERADQSLAGSVPLDAAYEYGKHCGFNQGLRAAEQLIAAIIDEEREGDT